MQDKTVLITGGNSGIGKEAAIAIAKQGATVVIACRNEISAQQAVEDIKNASGNTKVAFIKLDLASLQSVRDAVKQFKQQYNRLDVLLNNAGGAWATKQFSVDGFEYSFASNHLGHFLLTNLLLDMLVQAPEGRIVNVSSEVHRMTRFDFEQQINPDSYNQWKTYGFTKLCNVLFTYHLANKLNGTNVTVNAVHPGVVNTNFMKKLPGMLKTLASFAGSLFFLTPQKGAAPLVQLCTDTKLKGVTGKYFNRHKQTKSGEDSYNTQFQELLWQKSEEMTDLKDNK